MQLRLDAADRLVELVEERRGAVPVEDAARALFALAHLPEGMARSLLDDVVAGDARSRVARRVRRPRTTDAERVLLEDATFCVVDLETRPGSRRPARASARSARFESSASSSPERSRRSSTRASGCRSRSRRSPGSTQALCVEPRDGHRDEEVPGVLGEAVLVAHNARFDISFLDHAVLRLAGRRLAGPVVDTVWLARRLVAGRGSRFGLASLSHFFGTAARPCHRALPDAEATAEILLHLIGLAQERGARSVGDLVELGAAATPRLREALAGVRRADAAGRLPLPRRARSGAVRRSRARPARAPALVLPLGASASVGRGRARGSRIDRMARARLGARSGARGAAAVARAAAAGERALDSAGPLRLPRHPRRSRRRHEDAHGVRPCRAGAARRSWPARSSPPSSIAPAHRTPATASKALGACRGAPLRGRCAAARPRSAPWSRCGGARAAPASARGALRCGRACRGDEVRRVLFGRPCGRVCGADGAHGGRLELDRGPGRGAPLSSFRRSRGYRSS